MMMMVMVKHDSDDDGNDDDGNEEDRHQCLTQGHGWSAQGLSQADCSIHRLNSRGRADNQCIAMVKMMSCGNLSNCYSLPRLVHC